MSFALYDVDMSGTFTDQIRNITAQKAGGGTIGLTETGSADNTVVNSGLTTATVTGTNSTSNHAADVLFTSGANKVTSLTFTWSNPDATTRMRYIGFGNITFAATPEIGSGLGALFLCGSLAGSGRWRLRRT